MLDYGFENYVFEKLSPDSLTFSMPVISGDSPSVICAPADRLSSLLPKDHGAIVCKIELSRFEYAPVYKDETVGKITYLYDGIEIASSSIVALQSVELKKQKYTIWDKFIDFLSN